jgi:hypothetical protein
LYEIGKLALKLVLFVCLEEIFLNLKIMKIFFYYIFWKIYCVVFYVWVSWNWFLCVYEIGIKFIFPCGYSLGPAIFIGWLLFPTPLQFLLCYKPSVCYISVYFCILACSIALTAFAPGHTTLVMVVLSTLDAW